MAHGFKTLAIPSPDVRHVGHNPCDFPPLRNAMWGHNPSSLDIKAGGADPLPFPSLDVWHVGHNPRHCPPSLCIVVEDRYRNTKLYGESDQKNHSGEFPFPSHDLWHMGHNPRHLAPFICNAMKDVYRNTKLYGGSDQKDQNGKNTIA